jgi:hypothetical protein
MAKKRTNGADPMAPRLNRKNRTPKNKPLPGMEDVRVEEIDETLHSLSDVRRQLNDLRSTEQGLMQRVMRLMREHEVTSARAYGVEAVRVPGEEKLRVRTSKEQATAEVEEDGDDEQDMQEMPSGSLAADR